MSGREAKGKEGGGMRKGRRYSNGGLNKLIEDSPGTEKGGETSPTEDEKEEKKRNKPQLSLPTAELTSRKCNWEMLP